MMTFYDIHTHLSVEEMSAEADELTLPVILIIPNSALLEEQILIDLLSAMIPIASAFDQQIKTWVWLPYCRLFFLRGIHRSKPFSAQTENFLHVVSKSIAAFCSHATADRNQRLQLLVSLDLLQPETKFDPTHFWLPVALPLLLLRKPAIRKTNEMCRCLPPSLNI
jgi:hypothetical protein